MHAKDNRPPRATLPRATLVSSVGLDVFQFLFCDPEGMLYGVVHSKLYRQAPLTHSQDNCLGDTLWIWACSGMKSSRMNFETMKDTQNRRMKNFKEEKDCGWFQLIVNYKRLVNWKCFFFFFYYYYFHFLYRLQVVREYCFFLSVYYMWTLGVALLLPVSYPAIAIYIVRILFF